MRKLLLLSVLVVLTSCSHRFLDFTVISTKNIDMTKSSHFTRGKSRVSGKDKVHVIVFIPTGVPNLKEAVDRAIESTPNCIGLLDGVVYQKYFYGIIYSQSGYVIEGTPLIDPSLAESGIEIPKYRKIYLDKKGKIKSSEEITSAEYLAEKEKMTKKTKI
ncbi:hypothetical protein [Capnocytophaga canis]|uniref:Lipoprotein n=1 Tax=Capnocytophaga canis TaxID=1848903 RepID=A0A0B7IUG4_9FLAO|nr:hypothetical protein [Capnocytophaga canis]CEN53697.1 conserved exported hypothetical protein [Capnocytophaga canis]